ncbi:MAG: hypothetical protein OXE82_16790 [Rhodobacter sp.]|nr:hypothetical protein [Rhodobacter sp.]
MATIKVTALENLGENSPCIIALIGDDGRDFLKSQDPVKPLVAADIVSALETLGPTGQWDVEDYLDDGHLARLEPIAENVFQIFVAIEEIKSALENVSEIIWDPERLNPASEEAGHDTTDTEGVDGS